MLEDGCITRTSRDQRALEQRLLTLHDQFGASEAADLRLFKGEHVRYLHGGLGRLPGFACLDSGRPWLCYWVNHSLMLLKAAFPGNVSRAGDLPALQCSLCVFQDVPLNHP